MPDQGPELARTLFTLPNVPGITLGIPFADYLKLPGMSTSSLKKIIRSPFAYKWAKDHPEDDGASKSKAFGTATHAAILEPHRLKTDFLVWEGDRRGNAWIAFRDGAGGRQILTDKEHDAVMAAGASVRGHAPAMRYLEHGFAEVTIQWVDPVSGRPMRGRIDWLTYVDGHWVIVDLKSTRDSSPRWFGSDFYKFGYHLQAAIYTDGFFHLVRETPRFVVLAVENKEPFEPAVFNINEDVLCQGHDEYLGLLGTVQSCETSGQWPPAVQGEIDLVLPTWATASNDDDLTELGLEE